MVDNLTIGSLPQGLIPFAILSEIWVGDFHIDFAVLNALVSKHFTHIPLQDVVCKRVEDTAGFIRYSISHAEVGNLCEVYVQKLPRGLVRLSVIPPRDGTPPRWSDEQQRYIDSQPSVESARNAIYQMAEADSARRKRILNWQEMVVVIFLRSLLQDPELVRATKTLLDHLKDFATFIQSEVRMQFWKRDDKNKWRWVSRPEQYAQRHLRTFLNGRFENCVYVFEEVRSGAGFIDVLIVSPSEESVVVELKMCGHGYPESYAQGGMKQIIHYMGNRNVEIGCLMVFDSRVRDFMHGFHQGPEAHERKLITTIITDVRPYVKPEDVVADV